MRLVWEPIRQALYPIVREARAAELGYAKDRRLLAGLFSFVCVSTPHTLGTVPYLAPQTTMLELDFVTGQHAIVA